MDALNTGTVKSSVSYYLQYRVKVNISYSDWDDVTSGIHQASVLGPLLFFNLH